MSSIKCPSCGLVNFATANTCKRCNKPLAAAGESAFPPPRGFRLPLTSFYGIGVTLLDYRPSSAQTYEVTRWITFLWLPLIPISSWRIRPIKSESVNLGFAIGGQQNFEILEDRPLQLNRVLKTYALGYLIGAMAVLPMILAITFFPKPPTTLQTTLLVASAIWPILILGFIDRRHEKIYDQADRKGEG